MAQAQRITWIAGLFVALACCGTAAADATATNNPTTSTAAPQPTLTAPQTATSPQTPATPQVTTQQVAQALLKMTQDGDYADFIKRLAPSCQPDEALVAAGRACKDAGKKCLDRIPREEWSFLMRGHVIKKNVMTKLVIRHISEFDSCKLPSNIMRLVGDPHTTNGVYTIKPTHYVWVELTDPEFGTKQFLPLAIVRVDDNGWQIVGGSCVVKRPFLSLLKKYCDSTARH